MPTFSVRHRRARRPFAWFSHATISALSSAEIAFEKPARLGDVIAFDATVLKVGTTSVQVNVTGSVAGTQISSARLVFVNVGEDGRKAAVKAAVKTHSPKL